MKKAQLDDAVSVMRTDQQRPIFLVYLASASIEFCPLSSSGPQPGHHGNENSNSISINTKLRIM